MRKLHRLTATMALLTVIIVACGETASDDSPPETLTVIAHDSFASAAAEIGAFDGFTEETGIGVEVIAAGDAGSLVNQAVLTKDNPLADVLFGVDDTFLTRALDEEIFVSYRASLADTVDDALLREDDLVTPIDFGDVCINYDKQWFDDTGTPIPSDLDDLRDPDLSRQLTVEHPATSSPGLAFMFATIEEFGEPGWLDFWADLRDGQVNVVSDWDSAYYGAFIPYGGQSSMVVS
ncbi:MAG: thiamine ABC transporter substrate-binding protein, partial [Acidimicrobiia bacterium]